EKNNYFLPNFENIQADEDLLNSFDVDNIKFETLMWQTGYLTIKNQRESIRGMIYELDFPNKEVQISLMGAIADYITNNSQMVTQLNNIYEYLSKRNTEGFEKELKVLYSSIANNNFTKNNIDRFEGYYASVFYAYMKALGVDVQCEVATNRGRIDAVIKLPETIYIIEFKIDKKSSLDQIKAKKYYESFLNSTKTIILLGLEFSTKERNIISMESMVIKKQ
ncbi:MAG: PD-(D/E)XK nuclease domain-containing protein, partial [Candidatus Muirbacterium halophilum]|nr:PD-(D/E)XK nuclease domain-containing protein [Candidatus Muirbacterium halophilum]